MFKAVRVTSTRVYLYCFFLIVCTGICLTTERKLTKTVKDSVTRALKSTLRPRTATTTYSAKSSVFKRKDFAKNDFMYSPKRAQIAQHQHSCHFPVICEQNKKFFFFDYVVKNGKRCSCTTIVLHMYLEGFTMHALKKLKLLLRFFRV